MFYVGQYKVIFKHDRADIVDETLDNYEQAKKSVIDSKAKNGSTLCMVFNLEDNKMISFGWHTCQKWGCFNKNIQRKEAMKHALQNFDREIRTMFWHAYFDKRGKVN